jgi:hypothetical protein
MAELFDKYELTCCLVFRDSKGLPREAHPVIENVMCAVGDGFEVHTHFDLSDAYYIHNFSLDTRPDIKIEINIPLSTKHGILYTIASACIDSMTIGALMTDMFSKGIGVHENALPAFTTLCGISRSVFIRPEIVSIGKHLFISRVSCTMSRNYMDLVVKHLGKRRAQEHL